MKVHEGKTEHERAIIASAVANEELMAAVRESLAEVERGEPLIPGKLVREEAKARSARTLQT